MAGEPTRLGKQRALDAMLGRASPATFAGEIALLTSAATDSAMGTEYGATGYARQAVEFTAPTGADPPVSWNTALLTFGPFTAGTGLVITHAVLLTAGAGVVDPLTEMHYRWTLTTPKTPSTGDSATVAINALTASWT
jgi:hypothetical protein